MAQHMKNFLKLTRPHQNGWSLTRYMSHSNKDQIKLSSTALTQDHLMQNIKHSNSQRDVLEQVANHHTIMNSKHLLQALRTLFTMQKQGSSGMSTQQLLQNPHFEKLCQRLKKQAGLIELNETLEALKIVCYVGINSDSTIVQVLLQLVRHNINHLALPQIIFLDFLMYQFKPSPLVDAFKIALPMVFEIQLPAKMSRDNIEHLGEYLQYVSKRSVSEQCIELIIASAIKCQDEMDGRTAKSILWSICEMQPDMFFEPLINKAFNAFMINIEEISFPEIETTVMKLCYKYNSKFPFYYNECLMDICGNYIVDKDLGFEQGIYMLRKFMKIGHAHDNLVNYVCQKCVDNPALILQGDPVHVFLLISSIALTDQKPVHWKEIKSFITNTNCFKQCDRKEVIWIRLAASLVTLDIYKYEVIKKVMDPKFLIRALKTNYMADFENIILLQQILKTAQPEYHNLLLTESFLSSIIKELKPVQEFPLELALHKGLGGEQFVATNVKTNFGITIDHAIIFQNGFPLPLTKCEESLKTLEAPNNLDIIAILALRPHHYTLNGRRLRGTTSLTIKTLELKGVSVVPVCVEEWLELLDYEKIPYLMRTINENSRTRQVSNSMQ